MSARSFARLDFYPSCVMLKNVAFPKECAASKKRENIMTKKTTTKATKPLPSALTAASSADPSLATPPRRPRKAALAPKPTLPSVTTAQPPQPCLPPPPSKSPEPAVVAKPAPVSTLVRQATTTFLFQAPYATHVSLCGEFNAWSPDATAMTRQPDGCWKTTLALAPGRYQYKFLADGQWMHDPLARENVLNKHGSLNSVIEVRG